MNKLARTSLSVAIALTMYGCVNLEPRYHQAELPVTNSWPIAANAAESTDNTAAPIENGMPAADIGWHDFFVDSRLQQLIALSLQNNRDLRVAVLNIDRARAQY